MSGGFSRRAFLGRGVLLTAAAGTLIEALELYAQGAPMLMPYHGRLADAAGNPITNVVPGVPMSFRILDGANAPVWSESYPGVSVTKGRFTVTLGSQTALSPEVFSGPVRFLEVTINGETLSPNVPITSTAFVISSVTGPTGATGPTGPTGPSGPTGSTGPSGP